MHINLSLKISKFTLNRKHRSECSGNIVLDYFDLDINPIEVELLK